MFTSDFAKAFKQVPGVETMLHLSVVVQWDPVSRRPAFLVPYTQVFGGRSTPLNFARFPAWCCHAMAVLAALPCEHCVDDMISAERMKSMRSGWVVWRRFADHCGWRVPDVKSPEPSQQCIALGADFNLIQHPKGPMSVGIHDARIEAITSILTAIQEDEKLSCGLAGQVWGKLQHASSMLWGKFGSAKLRLFVRRQHEPSRLSLNPQLRHAIAWWIKVLHSRRYPREVPISPVDMPWAVSYSDGEGSEAGVGVAVWASGWDRPLAAYLKVPREVRRYWRPSVDGVDPRDIFEIEAIGPLVVLATWPRLMQGRRWIHFIDNAGAQCAYVKGSSSVHSGDLIVGSAWSIIARRRLMPWFDRVDTSSNPVDGLSRGRLEGPWREVLRGLLPAELLGELRRWHWG